MTVAVVRCLDRLEGAGQRVAEGRTGFGIEDVVVRPHDVVGDEGSTVVEGHPVADGERDRRVVDDLPRRGHFGHQLVVDGQPDEEGVARPDVLAGDERRGEQQVEVLGVALAVADDEGSGRADPVVPGVVRGCTDPSAATTLPPSDPMVIPPAAAPEVSAIVRRNWRRFHSAKTRPPV